MNRVIILEDLPDAQMWLKASVAAAYPGADIRCFSTLHPAILAITEFLPNLCIVDLRLPDGDGVDFIRQCKRHCPGTELVVATMYDDDAHLFPALQAGADGYLLKEEPQEAITRALLALASGQPALSAPVARRVLDQVRFQDTGRYRPGEGGSQDMDALSHRECEFLVAIAGGMTTAESAERLGVSYHTAARHIKNIYAKLAIRSRAEAVQAAIRLGLLDQH